MAKKVSGEASSPDWLYKGIGAIYSWEAVATPVDKKYKLHKAVQTDSTADNFRKEQDDDTQVVIRNFKVKRNEKRILGVRDIPFCVAENEKAVQTNESSISNKVRKTEDAAIKETEETEDDATKTKPGLGNTFNSLAGILLVVFIACLFAVVYVSTPEPQMKSDFDLVTIFENGVDELQQSFTNQTERFWMILMNRGLAHLRNKHPSQPLVFLLAAPPPAHEWVDCLATKLAKKLDPKHKKILATIDGNQQKDNSADKTKEKMDEILEEKFRAGQRVALIHHLELLPPQSPLLFYSYCDDQNAPYKHVAIIFTVNLPEEPSSSLSPKEAEGTVKKYLANKVWSNVDKDAVAALLSRIATTVALMNGESSNSLKAYCS